LREFEKADALVEVSLICVLVLADKLQALLLFFTPFRGLAVEVAGIIPATGCPGIERSIVSQNGF